MACDLESLLLADTRSKLASEVSAMTPRVSDLTKKADPYHRHLKPKKTHHGGKDASVFLPRYAGIMTGQASQHKEGKMHIPSMTLLSKAETLVERRTETQAPNGRVCTRSPQARVGPGALSSQWLCTALQARAARTSARHTPPVKTLLKLNKRERTHQPTLTTRNTRLPSRDF